MPSRIFLNESLKSSTRIVDALSFCAKSPRFWRKCTALCALFVSGQVSAMALSEYTHNFTCSSGTAVEVALPVVSAATGAVTYTVFDKAGIAVGDIASTLTPAFGRITMHDSVGVTDTVDWPRNGDYGLIFYTLNGDHSTDYFTVMAKDTAGNVRFEQYTVNSATIPADYVLTINANGQELNVDNVGGTIGLKFINGGSVEFGSLCTYTGPTFFDSSTSLIGSVPRTSSSYSKINVDSNVVYTETGQFTGPGALFKTGSGELVLANLGSDDSKNNYSGGTCIQDGILTVINDAQIPSVGTVSFEALTSEENSALKSNGLTLITNPIVFRSQGTVDTNGHSVTASGVLSGAGDVYKTGDGEFYASNSGNTQSGATHVNGGALRVTPNSLGQTSHIYLHGTLHVTASTTSVCPITLGGQ
ncbi:MAG: autotransporter-associated beta strand repeat-containing protein [Candidatus Paracaedibacteraceae bacterium]|nr:autotransporter-associated beta strand repeat-containing protein [Candidatus Paracaedibacteraceae bacterium]